MIKHLETIKVALVVVCVVTAMALYKRDFDKKAATKKEKPSEEDWE